jgi:hypothetical protein
MLVHRGEPDPVFLSTFANITPTLRQPWSSSMDPASRLQAPLCDGIETHRNIIRVAVPHIVQYTPSAMGEVLAWVTGALLQDSLNSSIVQPKVKRLYKGPDRLMRYPPPHGRLIIPRRVQANQPASSSVQYRCTAVAPICPAVMHQCTDL